MSRKTRLISWVRPIYYYLSIRDGVQQFTTKERAEAMGIDWMTGKELSQAIPPAYTEFIGGFLMERLEP